jgi:hypothetical protein
MIPPKLLDLEFPPLPFTRVVEPKAESRKPEAERKKALRRSPLLAETERRARFSYDDLLGLFSFVEFYRNARAASHY